MIPHEVTVIGGGLAGTEAALQLADRGVAWALLRRHGGLSRPDFAWRGVGSGRKRFRHREQNWHGGVVPQFFGLEKPDDPILSVVTCLSDHLAIAHAADGLGQERGAPARELLQGDVLEDRQLRPQAAEQFPVCDCGPTPHNSASTSSSGIKLR